MKKSVSGLAAVVLCSLGLASASSAQMMRGGGPPQFAGVFNPKVGAGAAYEIQKQDGNKTMEMAIVGKETVDGKDAYWWEMAMPDERAAGEFVFKILLVMDGENPHSSKVIMQLPGKPPMEMPVPNAGRRCVFLAAVRPGVRNAGCIWERQVIELRFIVGSAPIIIMMRLSRQGSMSTASPQRSLASKRTRIFRRDVVRCF